MSRDRKPRHPVKVFKFRAIFDKESYEVYGKPDGKSRVIFPIEDRHPEFSDAEPGTEFDVYFRNKKIRAMKLRKWPALRGANFPCLMWRKQGKTKPKDRGKSRLKSY